MKNTRKMLWILIFGIVSLLLIPNNVNASEKTDAMIRKIAPDAKNVTFKSVKPKDEAESFAFTTGILQKFIGENDYYIYAYCEAPEFTSCQVEIQSEDLETEWDTEEQKEVIIKGEKASYTLNATYDEPSDSNVKMVNNYISKLKAGDHNDGSTWYQVEDLSLINYYLTSSKSELWNIGAAGRAIKYVGELNKLIGGTSLNFGLDVNMGNQDETLMYESAFGFMNIFYGDYAYGYVENGVYLKRVLYIPESTANTKEAYIKAAQERVNEYLGNNKDVEITYGGLLSALPNGAEDTDVTVTSDGNYYNVKVLNRTYKFYIVKGSAEKLVAPTYNGKNLETNVSITSKDASVPLDTTINAKLITNKALKEKLGTENYVTYDINLYSDAKEEKIEKLENGKFIVTLPVPEELDGKDLIVYYINSDGEKEPHEVTPNKEGFVSFETNHFSEYTLAEIATGNQVKPPATGDNIILYGILGLISLFVISTCTAYINKKVIN